MMTLDEARTLQKQRESKALKKFFIPTIIFAIIFTLIYIYTDILSVGIVFYLFPLPIFLIIVKFSRITGFFAAKEFSGEVKDVHVYRITERVAKGVGRGHGARGVTHFEAELLVRNEKGHTKMQTFWGGDVILHLSEGDKIAILRFIDEPILIKGKYWMSDL